MLETLAAPGLLGSIILLITQIVILLQNRRQTAKLQELHVIMNSRLDQLVTSSKNTARLEGHAAGVSDEQKRGK